MKNIKYLLAFFIALFSLSFVNAQSTIVEKYGQLSVKGKYILGEKGDTVQLRGMSLFWSQWIPKYYTPETIQWLRDDWKCTIVRAAMGVEHGGYLENPEAEKQKIMKVVDAAINLGIYVIIDYHSHTAHKNPEPAKKFFAEMAEKYGKYPNVLYEIYNEPLKEADWSKDLKPYANTVIETIRQYDPDNIIIAGTRQWSQMVDEAAQNRLRDLNTVYTLHFYATSHPEWLREEAKRAMEKGIAVFVSEYGITEASGDGIIDSVEARKWYAFMDENKISWCNWSLADKKEASAALMPGASDLGHWNQKNISISGKFVRDELIKKNSPIFETLKKSKVSDSEKEKSKKKESKKQK